MKSRSSHVRIKVVALLVSLAALWGFAAFVTLREGLNLLAVDTLDNNVGRPAESLVDALQQERRLSVVYLGGQSGDQRAALLAQRARTDAASGTFRRLAGSGDTRADASPELRQRITDAFDRLDGLDRLRSAVDTATIGRDEAATGFTDVITPAFRVHGALAGLDNQQILREADALVALSRAREVLAQEDTLLAGAIAAGRFTGSEHERFIQLVGAQRLLHDEAAAGLPADDRDHYRQIAGGPTVAQLRAQEDLVSADGRDGAAPPIDARSWAAAVEPVFGELHDLDLKAAEHVDGHARPAIAWIVVRLLLAGGLGLIAVIASIVIAITTGRSLTNQLDKLRHAALELADVRLPHLVSRLRAGEDVDVDAEAPPLAVGTGEIGQLSQAFNAVQQTAIRAAVEQAELRRRVRDVFLSLARRTQTLVHRQLSVLDGMERRETDPEELAALFRVDHLATRMRRNAENLIVLSGAVPGRGWRQPVPMVDVVRGAVAEIEDYERVKVLPIGPTALAGRVVGDVIHLLAELIENATSFSPPNTPVHVGGQKVANGFAVEIEDRGLGMSEVDLELVNERLRHPPEFKLSSTARLGLYVVGRLAERHGIRIRLRESAYGGVMAIVLIPSALVVDPEEVEAQPVRVEPSHIEGVTWIAVEAATAGTPAPKPEPEPEPVAPGWEPVAPTWEPPAPESAAPEPAPTASFGETPNGLPRRVRQANLAAPLRNEPVADTPAYPGARRAPEDIRQMLSAYQRQTRRGRTDAGQVPPDDGTGNHLVATAPVGENPGDPHGEDRS